MPPRNPIHIPLACDRCGGEWFRKVGFRRFDAHRYRGRDQISLVSPEQDSPCMEVLVCLCGRPQRPNLSGVRSPTMERFTQSLLKAIAEAHARTPEHVLSQAREDCDGWQTPLHAYKRMEERLDKLQQDVYALARTITGVTLFGRQRWTGPSRRKADSAGRDVLVTALQHRGVPFRLANRAVSAVVECWKAALLRGETVSLEAGTLKVKRGLSGNRVAFRRTSKEICPSEQFGFYPKSIMVPPNADTMICERCGSPWMAEVEFRRYAAGTYGSRVGESYQLLPEEEKQSAFVCLCGYPFLNPRRRTTSKFELALAQAQTYTKVEAAFQKGFAQLRSNMMEPQDASRLNSRLDRLETELADLRQRRARRSEKKSGQKQNNKPETKR